jgi:hypothetical protein
LDAGFLRSPQPAAVEAGRRLRGETNLVRRASPAIFAFPMPKASALKFHQSNGSRLDNALLALRKDSRVLRHRRASADCFGANPVASALGTTPGATLTRLCEHTMRVSSRPSKPELSTWLGTGTSYLAATRCFRSTGDPRRFPAHLSGFFRSVAHSETCPQRRSARSLPIWGARRPSAANRLGPVAPLLT